VLWDFLTLTWNIIRKSRNNTYSDYLQPFESCTNSKERRPTKWTARVRHPVASLKTFIFTATSIRIVFFQRRWRRPKRELDHLPVWHVMLASRKHAILHLCPL
jgi:hypothetical protein